MRSHCCFCTRQISKAAPLLLLVHFSADIKSRTVRHIKLVIKENVYGFYEGIKQIDIDTCVWLVASFAELEGLFEALEVALNRTSWLIRKWFSWQWKTRMAEGLWKTSGRCEVREGSRRVQGSGVSVALARSSSRVAESGVARLTRATSDRLQQSLAHRLPLTHVHGLSLIHCLWLKLTQMCIKEKRNQWQKERQVIRIRKRRPWSS